MDELRLVDSCVQLGLWRQLLLFNGPEIRCWVPDRTSVAKLPSRVMFAVQILKSLARHMRIYLGRREITVA